MVKRNEDATHQFGDRIRRKFDSPFKLADGDLKAACQNWSQFATSSMFVFAVQRLPPGFGHSLES